jgi:hypothetical protein
MDQTPDPGALRRHPVDQDLAPRGVPVARVAPRHRRKVAATLRAWRARSLKALAGYSAVGV